MEGLSAWMALLGGLLVAFILYGRPSSRRRALIERLRTWVRMITTTGGDDPAAARSPTNAPLNWLRNLYWIAVVAVPVLTGFFHLPPHTATLREQLAHSLTVFGYVLLVSRVGSGFQPKDQRALFMSRAWTWAGALLACSLWMNLALDY